MKKTSIAIISTAAMLLSTIFSSCSSEDVLGDWDPMKWKTEVKTIKEDGVKLVKVPAEGGTYEYACKNYDRFWISEIADVPRFGYDYDTSISSTYYNADDGTWRHLDCPVADVSVSGNRLSVTIKPNTTGTTRRITVSVTAGDIFSRFHYKQD